MFLHNSPSPAIHLVLFLYCRLSNVECGWSYLGEWMRNIVVVDCGFFSELRLVCWIHSAVSWSQSANPRSRVVDFVPFESAVGAGGFRISEKLGRGIEVSMSRSRPILLWSFTFVCAQKYGCKRKWLLDNLGFRALTWFPCKVAGVVGNLLVSSRCVKRLKADIIKRIIRLLSYRIKTDTHSLSLAGKGFFYFESLENIFLLCKFEKEQVCNSK